MKYGELTAVISSLAIVIANSITDDELDLLSVTLTQLGDTLATISLQRGLSKK